MNNNPVLRSVNSRSAVGKVMTTAQAEKIMLETASLMVLNARCTLTLTPTLLVTQTLTLTLTLTSTLTLNPTQTVSYQASGKR